MSKKIFLIILLFIIVALILVEKTVFDVKGNVDDKTIVMQFGPFDLPEKSHAIMPMGRKKVNLPKGQVITSMEFVTKDQQGNPVEGEFICHINVGPRKNDFMHGEKVLLDGYTTSLDIPEGFGVGIFEEEFWIDLMYNNPSENKIEGVKSQLTLKIEPSRPDMKVLTSQMMSVFDQPEHIAKGQWGYYVLGGKSDLKTRLADILQDFEIYKVMFHVHENSKRISLMNKTSGETISDVVPVLGNGKMKKVSPVNYPAGLKVRKGDVLELSVEYNNPLDVPIDAMGAVVLLGSCSNGSSICQPMATRPADNQDFNAELYYSLLGGGYQQMFNKHQH